MVRMAEKRWGSVRERRGRCWWEKVSRGTMGKKG
jgi:hypothetical protein